MLRTRSKFHGYAYDGLWALALAIESVERRIRQGQVVDDMTGRRLRSIAADFDYRNPLWGELFRRALTTDVQFDGVTGRVRFHNNARIGLITVRQFQSGRDLDKRRDVSKREAEPANVQQQKTRRAGERKVAEFDAHTGILDFASRDTVDVAWAQGATQPPKAEPRILRRHLYIGIGVFLAMSVFAVLGTVLACFFLVFNIRCRHHPYIKMSSPYLNNVIAIGALFCYAAVVLLGLDGGLVGVDKVPYVCMVSLEWGKLLVFFFMKRGERVDLRRKGYKIWEYFILIL